MIFNHALETKRLVGLEMPENVLSILTPEKNAAGIPAGAPSTLRRVTQHEARNGLPGVCGQTSATNWRPPKGCPDTCARRYRIRPC